MLFEEAPTVATSPTWNTPQAPRLSRYPWIESFPSLAALDLVSALDLVLNCGMSKQGQWIHPAQIGKHGQVAATKPNLSPHCL